MKPKTYKKAIHDNLIERKPKKIMKPIFQNERRKVK